ncbi:hypothetical protein L9F63_022840, partial [Diploptera punctata]
IIMDFSLTAKVLHSRLELAVSSGLGPEEAEKLPLASWISEDGVSVSFMGLGREYTHFSVFLCRIQIMGRSNMMGSGYDRVVDPRDKLSSIQSRDVP